MEFTILECRAFHSPPGQGNGQTRRLVKDFEIDLELSMGREYTIGSGSYTLRRGDMCVRYPGQVLTARGVQNSLLLTLDFSGLVPAAGYSRNTKGPIQPPITHSLAAELDNVIRFDDFTPIRSLYDQLLDCVDYSTPSARLLVRALLHLANAQVCRLRYAGQTRADTPPEAAVRYMREHLSEEITLDMLAKEAFLDKSYLIRLFRKQFGKTPIEMLISMRLEKARELVLCTQLKIGEIAELCGYRSGSFFIAAYAKQYGLTPQQHRQSQSAGSSGNV
ncbi:MAG: helix-turn-helix transcriptional regulator [Clostridia bacterium]|nr:helix-turn-helix transcriptional regulator [Clostridia bacterium]